MAIHFEGPHLSDKIDDAGKVEALLRWAQDLTNSLNRLSSAIDNNERDGAKNGNSK